jgi:hypothetical protein
MGARDGAGSRFDLACAEAAKFLDAANPDFANVVWIDTSPDAVFPLPAPNHAFLVESLKSAKPTLESGSPAAAIDLALNQLSQTKGQRKLVLISDFQATAWKSTHLQIPSGITFIPFQAAASSPANTCVQQVIPQPADPVAGQPLTLLARVRNFSAEAVAPTITLDASGARQSQSVSLAPWGEADCLFSLRPSRPGPLAVSVSTSPDAFPADDSHHAVVLVRDALRLGIDATQPGPFHAADAPILAKLTKAVGWLELQEANGNSHADFHWIPAWNGENPEKIRSLLQHGTTTILRPAPNCPPAALRELLALKADPATPRQMSSKDGWEVIPEPTHPANSLFQSGDFGNPYAGRFRERIDLPLCANLPTSARVVARYQDDVPAVVVFPTQSNQAPLVLWNLPLDPAKTDWPTRNAFLPCLAELLLHTRTNPSESPTSSLPGSALSWKSTDPTLDTRSLTLLAPDGSPLAARQSQQDPDQGWASAPTSSTGIHRWQVSGQDVALSAVNFPPGESDLRPLPGPPSSDAASANVNSLTREAELSRGIPLWPWLVALALAMLATEPLLQPRRSTAAS